ncbi:MAG TPA: aminotransferase class IV [Bryobacteraceae bacterium]|nr:aminotransferase class IV [Bryobacteraceae bacterium]
MYRHILHNEEIRESSDKLLAAGQVGLLAGWGVFTTIRVMDGVLFAFERHWARMQRDAALFQVKLPSDPERVRRNLLKLLEANQATNATLRVVVVRNVGGAWEGPQERESDLIALLSGLKEWGAGVKLAYQEQARHAACMFAGTKILSWSMNLRWLEIAQSRGFDEVILLNEHGQVSECTSANIFIANGNQVWTPPLSSGCLPGVTREVLLSEIHVPGFPIGEKALTPGDLAAADEVFITSTTRELLPVLEIESQKLRNRGPARLALQNAFSAYVNAYIAQHREQPVGKA